MADILPLRRNPPTDTMTRLRAQFSEEMAAVEILMRENMGSYVDMIPAIGEHIVKAGGKRLRPILTLAGARLCNYSGEAQISLAAAVEYMHTATLLHDDVVDESDLRRSLPTARKVWGNAASVLVGDFMLGQAFRMMVAAGSLKALDILSHAAAVIAEGEVMQLANLHNVDMTEDAYLQVVDAKTATLFAAAAEVGGVIAEANLRELDGIRSYGRNLGIAFQLVDDALDYASHSETLGKNIGDDFREGKITLPILLAVRRGSEADRGFWNRVVRTPSDDPTDFKHALKLMYETKALEETRERARHYGARAVDALALFPSSPLKSELIDLVQFCIARAY